MKAAFGRIFLTCCLAACAAGPAYAFDGADKSTPSNQTLDIFKDPRQALEVALENYRAGNPASSVEALKYAAAGGEPLAQWKLGKMYADGDGVPRDDYKAYQYFQQLRLFMTVSTLTGSCLSGITLRCPDMDCTHQSLTH